MGLGGFPSSHPLCLGMLGMHGTYAANMAVAESDLLIALGVRFDDRVTGKLATFAPHARVIHVDIDPANIGKNVAPTLAIAGDVKTGAVSSFADSEQRERTAARFLETRSVVGTDTTLAAIATASLLRLAEPDQTANRHSRTASADKGRSDNCHRRGPASDVGGPVLSVHQTTTTDYERRTRNDGLWFACGNRRATRMPESTGRRRCWRRWISDDEPGAGNRGPIRLPVKILIMNNGYLGMVRQWQEMFYDRTYSEVDISVAPDFVKLAEAYGAAGFRAERPTELHERARSGARSQGRRGGGCRCFERGERFSDRAGGRQRAT